MGIKFGRMTRGTGTEAGTGTMAVLGDHGRAIGVIEAELTDANERSATRAKRWRVVGYNLVLWEPEAEIACPVAADGPKAALARAKAHAVRVTS